MTVFKRAGSSIWQCKFTLDGTTVRETTGCRSKIDAQAWEVRRREKIRRAAKAARLGYRHSTLYDLAQAWLSVSEKTHRDHRNNVSRVRKLFGGRLHQTRWQHWHLVEGSRAGLPRDLHVASLTQAHLIELKAARLKEGASFATVNREIALAQTLIGFAKSLNVLTPDPPLVWSYGRNKAASLKLPERQGKLRWLTMTEEQRLLSSLRDAVDRQGGNQAAIDAYMLTVFLLDTGARYNEVARLRWSQVDLADGTVNLYRSKVQNESTLKLPQRTLTMLRTRWRAMEGQGYSYVFPKFRGASWAGVDLPRGHATQTVQAHINRCGLNSNPLEDKVTPHTFRDTYAARLVQAGVSLQKVAHLLGHASVLMTQKYAHLCPEATGAEAAAVLDNLHSIRSRNTGRPILGDAHNLAR